MFPLPFVSPVFYPTPTRFYSKSLSRRDALNQSSRPSSSISLFRSSVITFPFSVIRFKPEIKTFRDSARRLRCSGLMAHSSFSSDALAMAFSVTLALSLLRLFEETARRGIFAQVTNRKLAHICIGIGFILCWPLFSVGSTAPLVAAIIPGVQAVKMLLIGSGLWRDESTVKSMTRYGNPRELLTGPLFYAATITYACVVYWRTSTAISVVSNLCAGDGFADIIGRRFGTTKIIYNKNKTLAGSLAMAVCGFAASLGLMCYFASFGFLQSSWDLVMKFFIISTASAIVESLPFGSKLDDNLTVPITSMFLGSLLFK